MEYPIIDAIRGIKKEITHRLGEILHKISKEEVLLISDYLLKGTGKYFILEKRERNKWVNFGCFEVESFCGFELAREFPIHLLWKLIIQDAHACNQREPLSYETLSQNPMEHSPLLREMMNHVKNNDDIGLWIASVVFEEKVTYFDAVTSLLRFPSALIRCRLIDHVNRIQTYVSAYEFFDKDQSQYPGYTVLDLF